MRDEVSIYPTRDRLVNVYFRLLSFYYVFSIFEFPGSALLRAFSRTTARSETA
jgi:hypothetical protein